MQKDSYDKVFEALSFFEERKIPTYMQVMLANDYISDEEATIKEAENAIVEFDVTVDKYIRLLSGK